jgi:hypothetical protein
MMELELLLDAANPIFLLVSIVLVSLTMRRKHDGLLLP